MGWRVIVADDHAVTRHGVRLLVDGLEGVEVVGEASTGNEAIELAKELRPDVILMDLDMPELGGLEATRRIRAEQPDVAVLILTVHEDGEAVYEAIRAGANGYLPKASSLTEIRSAFDALASGGAFMSPSVAGAALGYLSRKAEDAHKAAAATDMTTPREREILELLGR